MEREREPRGNSWVKDARAMGSKEQGVNEG